MYVVVVGSREWREDWAQVQVKMLLDGLKQKYSGLVVVSSSCDRGVGQLVKDYCLQDRTTFEFIDVHIRVFAKLPRSKLSQVFYARNAALAELGEEFHVCVDADRKGAFEDLVERLERMEMKRPLYKHFPRSLTEAEAGMRENTGLDSKMPHFGSGGQEK